MSFNVVAVFVLIILLIFSIFIMNNNPYFYRVQKLINDHYNTMLFGSFIQVYDLSTPRRVERLFVLIPENIILYNFEGELFYYLESASVFCPAEFAVVRFDRNIISSINKSGLYTTTCTNINSLTLLDHFVSLKNNVPDHLIIFNVDEVINYTTLDIINMLIYDGYVYLK